MGLRVLLFETPGDPYYNLAFEEAVLYARHAGLVDDTLRIWRNENAVVVGYFQYAEEEVRIEKAREIGAHVVRRFTGGGAVYHDLGNINYAITVSGREMPGSSLVEKMYTFLLGGALNALRILGAEPRLENINDVVVGNRKVSGCAAKYMGGTYFLHGSLLVDTRLDVLRSVLKVSAAKLADKGVSDVKYRVTNLSEHLGRKVGYWEVVRALVEGYSQLLREEPYFDMPSREELMLADHLAAKYRSREWNYGRAPSWKYGNPLALLKGGEPPGEEGDAH